MLPFTVSSRWELLIVAYGRASGGLAVVRIRPKIGSGLQAPGFRKCLKQKPEARSQKPS